MQLGVGSLSLSENLCICINVSNLLLDLLLVLPCQK